MSENSQTIRTRIVTETDLTGIHKAMDEHNAFAKMVEEEYNRNKFRLAEQRKWIEQSRFDDNVTMQAMAQKKALQKEIIDQSRFDDNVTMQALAVKRKEDNAFYKSSIIDINQKMNLEKQSRAEQKQYWMERESDIKAEMAIETTAQKEITNARNEKIKAINLENKELRINAQAATQSLGANLGLLFATMGVARAMSSTTMLMEKYGMVSEKTGEKMRKFSDIFNVVSQLFTSYISVMMLVQALEARRSQRLINDNIQRQIAVQKETEITTQLTAQAAIGGAASGAAAGAGVGASAGMAAAIPYVGLVLAALGIGFAGYTAYKSRKNALGYDDIVTSPQIMLVGENGPERVNVSPMGTSGSGGGGTTIINVYGYNNEDTIRRDFAKVLTDVQRGRA